MYADIRRVALSDLGLKLHHSFNANTRHSNPGMDSHIIYTGISFFSR